MPCFKGIAVSIHANGAPLPEYGAQKQSRFSRISTYIPVPQPRVDPGSHKPEPAKFAISITLLTPGLPIPYSTPKPTEGTPYPKPQFVGGLPATNIEGGKNGGSVNPYIPMTTSENETIAAYIYFDGRSKEEVATLLRPGEETWVNSRWVQVPDIEGGGLAEREFLFREVGLERWLNGLDLQGHDAAEKLEKRRQKFERRRRRQRGTAEGPGAGSRDTLKYGTDEDSPVEAILDDLSSDSLSDDDEPPEATGQIKVLMFRVLASGEIKKGEYSPQFDAHDDDEEQSGNKTAANVGMDADVEHTTSFAKPKSLDPKTISTQTVTGIDGPEKPYASFTFFYRGDRQLQKIGVLSSTKTTQATPSSAKRRSGQLDFSTLGPLKSTGTVGFSTFRDQGAETTRRRKARKKSIGNVSGALNDDSDEDDDDNSAVMGKMDEVDEKDFGVTLAAEDLRSHGELADGVDRIHLKRAHSAEPGAVPLNEDKSNIDSALASLGSGLSAVNQDKMSTVDDADKSGNGLLPNAVFGSPLKKHRASLQGGGEAHLGLAAALNASAPLTATSASGLLTDTRDANKELNGKDRAAEEEEEEEL